MVIKEYADRIREEITQTYSEMDTVRDKAIKDGEYKGVTLGTLQGRIEGLNKALDTYLDLVKEDL